MKAIKPSAAPLKQPAAYQPEIVGLQNTSATVPAKLTNADVNKNVGENVQKGVERMTVNMSTSALPASERLRIGAAAERVANTEIPAAGGGKGAVSDIGETATVAPKKR